MKILNKCLMCGKEHNNAKFCSRVCYYKYFKKYKLGYWNSESQSKLGKATAIVNEKNKTGFCYDKKLQSKGSKKGNATQKRKRLGFCDPKIQSMGGRASLEKQRMNKNIKFKNLYFSNYAELEFGLNLHYQQEKLVESINFQIRVGSKIFDFKIEKHKCFIEFHPWDFDGLSDKEYFNARREVLDENSYKDYNLIVIK